ncbi:MAG: hypothetical protein KBT03_10840 [Bacteroidales bacterium]|nr:hypothetical protein [Candidatus Scybalousia scybalohippi]
MAYATSADVKARLIRTISADEETVCNSLLEDAAILIDAYNKNADEEAKKVVSCRMVIRAIGSEDSAPIGATQGSMSALGYSQSWTIGNGSVGQLYLDKTDKKYLGCGSKIGAHSPIEGM